MEGFRLPVLFVIFNRPEMSQRSFSFIRTAKPNKLYIASDGARLDHPGEEEVVARTRSSVLAMIDWDCEVQTLFQEQNLGCGPGVYTAISWFFEHEEMGVVIEDDCIVSESFFPFMEQMLTRYATDQRIGMVAGFNPNPMPQLADSYLFSRFKCCWGWGSWRRAWQGMDIEMDWRNSDADSVIWNCGYGGRDRSEWLYKLKCIDRGYVSAWDWQWYFSLAAQNQLCVFPKVNLVSNEGNDAAATHTAIGNIYKPRYDLQFPLKYPQRMVPNEKFEKAFYRRSNSFYRRLVRWVPYGVKKQLKRWIIALKK